MATLSCCVVGPLFEPAAGERRTWRWNYPPPRASTAPLPASGDLTITEFVDRRNGANEDRAFLALVPFVWSGARIDRTPTPQVLAEVAAGRRATFVTTADVTAAFVDEIEAARLFGRVQRGATPAPDYVLRGELLSSECDWEFYGYGLSLLAMVPWMFGAPWVTTRNEVVVRVTLARGATGTALWTYELSTSDEDWVTIYSARIGYRFDALLHTAMPALVASLRAELVRQTR